MLTLVGVLSACGGGGGSGTPPPANPVQITSANSLSVLENTKTIGRIEATDANNNPIVLSLSGGADSALFVLNDNTLSFINAPDFELPSDADGNNVYQLQITATAGENRASQNISIRVTDTDDKLSITMAPEVTFNENNFRSDITIEIFNPADEELSISLSGVDSDAFGTGGVGRKWLYFTTTPNFEMPHDADGDNRYQVTITVSAGAQQVSKDITVRVLNVDERPDFTFPSARNLTLQENTTLVTRLSAVDPEGDAITYLLGDDDQALFEVVGDELHFKTAPDFDIPSDADTNNIYKVWVAATANDLQSYKNLTVEVSNVDEPPRITSASSVVLDETVPDVLQITTLDPDGDAVALSVSGVDADRFVIQGKVLRFITLSNYDAPDDANGDNVYELQLTATAQQLSASQDLTVTVTDVTTEIKLNDTGISLCAADGDADTQPSSTIDCLNGATAPNMPLAQDAFSGRDKQAFDGTLSKVGAGAAGFDFTKLDENGDDLPASAATWHCVRDNHTGLIWEVKQDSGLHDSRTKYTWFEPDSTRNGGGVGYRDGWVRHTQALSPGNHTLKWTFSNPGSYQRDTDASNVVYIDSLRIVTSNGSEQGESFDDGRVPSNWRRSAGVDASWEVTTENPQAGSYSLRNQDIEYQQTAAIEFTLNLTQSANIEFYYRVASGQQLRDDLLFSINDEIQLRSGGHYPGTMDTAEFVDEVNRVALCGANDWRMPTVTELMSIYHFGKDGYPRLDENYFSGAFYTTREFWSSTPTTLFPSLNSSSYVLIMDFDTFAPILYARKNQLNLTRLVRKP